MKVLIDSTVLIHLQNHYSKMMLIMKNFGVSEVFISRINYLELLAGASENAKAPTKKFLQPFKILEFDVAAVKVANRLAMKHRVGKRNQKDFFIAAIATANGLPLLTENDKDFNYTALKVLAYRISA